LPPGTPVEPAVIEESVHDCDQTCLASHGGR
jgi:hypothetical protein